MAYDGVFLGLDGPRPANATQFMSPFGAYDIAGLATRGLKQFSVPKKMVANVAGGHTWEWVNIGGSILQYQATGQTGTITQQTDSTLGGNADRPTELWSADTDLKLAFGAAVLPSTADWCLFGTDLPTPNTYKVAGTDQSGNLSLNFVNNELRGSMANSGSGGFAATANPDGANILSRTIGWMFERRGNVLTWSWHFAGGNGGVWQEFAASQPATTGASGTGSNLPVTGSLFWGNAIVAGGYHAGGRRSIRGVFVPVSGTMLGSDRTMIRDMIDGYAGL